jgi:hypothetical protein
MEVQVERVAPRAGLGGRQASQQAGGERLQQHAGDAMPQAHAFALGVVMQQGSGEQVTVVASRRHQAAHHVERVPPVGDRHACEERPGFGGQEAARQVGLVGPDSGAQVSEELLDPMHR